MRNYARLLSTVLTLLVFDVGISQIKQEIIDLSDKSVLTQHINAGEILNISIENLLVNQEYSIKVEKRIDLLQDLEIDSNAKLLPLSGNTCQLEKLVDEIYKIDSEKKLSNKIIELEKELKRLQTVEPSGDGIRQGCTHEQIENAKSTIQSTKRDLLPQVLEKGELLEVTISRKKKGSETEYEVWKRTYTTTKKGKWLTTYGFTYITQAFKKNEPFFAKQVDSTFAITPLNRRSRLSFVPSIFFTWLPNSDIDKDVSWSMTGGLGYDLEAPTIFLGANLLYNQNLGISFGIAAHQQDFLNGQYSDGEIIKENLGSEQLNEKLYVFNPFISINFRFGTTPLKAESSE